MNPMTQFCHNLECRARGQLGQGNITIQAAFGLNERTVASWLQRAGQPGLLLDRLNATPDAHIVTASSWSHQSGSSDFDDLNSEQDYQPGRAYAQSKLANLLFTYELQRRLVAAGQSTLTAAAHPGWAATNAQRHSPILKSLNPIFAQPPKMGMLPTLYAATAPDVRGGDYFGPGGLGQMRGYPRKVGSSRRSHDEAVARRLWTVCEELTHVTYTFAPVKVPAGR